MGVAKGVASRIDDAPVPKIVTFQKSFTTENEEKTIFPLQRSPAGICKSHLKSEEKKEFMHHSFFKISRNIDSHYKRAFREGCKGRGGGGKGGLDHVSRKIKRSFHNSRKIKKGITLHGYYGNHDSRGKN